jgi:peptidoglycan hydrolase-like protein with peptidoglycan-binding domain
MPLETLGPFGYEPGPIDGVMRFKTGSARRALQQKHGLSVKGLPSPWPPLGSKTSFSDGGIEDDVCRKLGIPSASTS